MSRRAPPKPAALPGAGFVLIGPLQRNKARLAVERFEEILTLDRPDLASRLRRLAEELDRVRPGLDRAGAWMRPPSREAVRSGTFPPCWPR